MIIVIQCAASKHPDAGHLMTASGKPVVFVVDPQAAPAEPGLVYARPDDPSDRGMTWRQVLLNYNEDPEDNPFGLYPAHQLYENRTYKRLKTWGFEDVPSASGLPVRDPLHRRAGSVAELSHARNAPHARRQT